MTPNNPSGRRWQRLATIMLVSMLAVTMLVTGCSPAATPTVAPTKAPAAATAAPAAPTAAPTKAPAAPTAGAASVKDSLVIGLGTNITTPDNHKLTGLPGIGAAAQVGDVLVRLNEKGEVVPWLITKWETADGGKQLVLTIRDNVKMHNGAIMTADDVAYSIERFRTLAVGKASLDPVKKVQVLDPKRVALVCDAPFAPLLRTLAYTSITIYTKAEIEKWGNDNFGLHVSGMGPYKMTEFKAGDKMVLQAFDDYWGGKPKIRNITFRMIPEMSARILGLESGDLDLIDAIAPQDAERLAKDTKLQILNPPSAGLTRLYFNTQKGPLTNKLVRQALNYAVDKESIVKNIFLGKATVGHSWAPEGTFGYTGEYDVYKYDPAKAKALLQQAGVSNLKFTLMHSPGRYLLSTEVSEVIKSQLAQVGVTMEIQNLEWGTFSSVTKLPLAETKMEASFHWWRSINGDADSAIADFASKFYPPANNTSFFTNAEYDQLHVSEQIEQDPAKRAQMLKRMQQILMDEMPGILLYMQPNLWGAKAGLSGIEINALSCLQPMHTVLFTK